MSVLEVNAPLQRSRKRNSEKQACLYIDIRTEKFTICGLQSRIVVVEIAISIRADLGSASSEVR